MTASVRRLPEPSPRLHAVPEPGPHASPDPELPADTQLLEPEPEVPRAVQEPASRQRSDALPQPAGHLHVLPQAGPQLHARPEPAPNPEPQPRPTLEPGARRRAAAEPGPQTRPTTFGPHPELHAVPEREPEVPDPGALPEPEQQPQPRALPEPAPQTQLTLGPRPDLRAVPEPGTKLPGSRPRAVPGPGRRPRLRALPEYEPSYAPGEVPPRWSSLRPATGPQLTLVTPPQEPTIGDEALQRLLMRILEVLEGRRNVGQLHTLLSPPAYEALLTRLRITTPGRAHRMRRVLTCYPSATAVEITTVIDIAAARGERARVCAMATRLERAGASWHCAVLRVL